MKKKQLSLDFRFYTINKESKRKTKEKICLFNTQNTVSNFMINQGR